MAVFLSLVAISVFLGIWLMKALTLIIGGAIVAGIVGTLADKIVPGDLPFGMPGAILAGWLGFVLGHSLIGSFGPSIAGYYLLPGFLGAVIIAFLAEVLGSKKRS